MAVCAPHFAFAKLFLDLGQRISSSNQIADLALLDAPDVIQFKHYRIILTAIYAYVSAHELSYKLL